MKIKNEKCCKCKQKDIILVTKNNFNQEDLDWLCEPCYTTKHGELKIDPKFDLRIDNAKQT